MRRRVAGRFAPLVHAWLALALLAAACGSAPPSTTAPAALGSPVPDEGRGPHLAGDTPITYRNDPPASGPHYLETAPYNVYTDAVPPGYWVHDLEHGAIVVLYRCPGDAAACPAVSKQLQGLYQAAPPGKYGRVKMVVTQYRTLRTPYALLAWNRIAPFERYDQAAMLAFYRAYVDEGPEDVP